MMLFTLIWICVTSALVESKIKLDDIVPPCSLNDVNVDECIKNSGQNILPTLAKGVKDWHLIGLDPMLIPSIILGQDSGPISLRWEHINTTISGYGQVTINNATVSKKGNLYIFGFNVTTKDFSMIGEYKGRGRMLLFPIKSEGHEEIYSGPSKLRITMEAKAEKNNNVEHLKIQKLDLKVDFSKNMKVLVKGHNKKPTPLDKILSRFLTDNAPEIVQEMRPTFEKAFGEIIKNYLQTFFDKVPVKDLFKQ